MRRHSADGVDQATNSAGLRLFRDVVVLTLLVAGSILAFAPIGLERASTTPGDAADDLLQLLVRCEPGSLGQNEAAALKAAE